MSCGALALEPASIRQADACGCLAGAHPLWVALDSMCCADVVQVLIRSVCNFAGYYKAQDKTDEVLEAGNWFHSGEGKNESNDETAGTLEAITWHAPTVPTRHAARFQPGTRHVSNPAQATSRSSRPRAPSASWTARRTSSSCRRCVWPCACRVSRVACRVCVFPAHCARLGTWTARRRHPGAATACPGHKRSRKDS